MFSDHNLVAQHKTVSAFCTIKEEKIVCTHCVSKSNSAYPRRGLARELAVEIAN